MMTQHCPETPKVQDWLDGALAPAEAASFEAHVAGCELCAAEAAGYRVLYSELRALPLLDPRPELFHRIMDAVLPHRTPQWVRIVGWTYAGSIAASLAVIASAMFVPGPNAWLRGVIAAGTRALTDTGTFVVRSMGTGFARAGEVFAGEAGIGRTIKLLWSALAHPEVLVTLLAAVSVCAALIWWMRPRERRATGEMPNVGLLGL
jgi:hypothetical protein